jgi:regulator of RNase E activity RraA
MWSPHRQGFNSSTCPTIIGEAITVKMVDAKDTTSPKPPKHFVDVSEPGKIMYISQPKGMYSACFGGLMAARSKIIGAAGVVIDGRFRDVAEIQGFGLPVSCVNVLCLRLTIGNQTATALCKRNFDSRIQHFYSGK